MNIDSIQPILDNYEEPQSESSESESDSEIDKRIRNSVPHNIFNKSYKGKKGFKTSTVDDSSSGEETSECKINYDGGEKIHLEKENNKKKYYSKTPGYIKKEKNILIKTNKQEQFKRSFHIIKKDGLEGRYRGLFPSRAAKKAFSALAKDHDQYEIQFWIIESTEGYPNKKFKFLGNKIKLKKPIIINREGKKFEIWHKNTVKRLF